MNRILAVILICSLGCQSLARLGIFAWYEINKDYIAKNLCENRNNPQLHCNGKCCLKKKLDKTNDGTDKSAPNKWDKEQTLFIIEQFADIKVLLFSSTESVIGKKYYFKENKFAKSIFRPPPASKLSSNS